MTLDALRDLVSRLGTSANALAAVGAALDARLSGNPLDAGIRAPIDDVLATLGVDSLEEAAPVALRSLLGEIRTFTLTNAKLLFAASRGMGWGHTEPEILEAAGEVSATFPHVFKDRIAPDLDGLVDRLARPGASFLDVGVGVAALSIEMARLWPSLRVVGIDPWVPALAVARERVSAAGLDARIELREQSGEDLADTDAFDLAWIPSVFVPDRALPVVLERVHRALRPGGWMLLPMMKPGGDQLAASLVRLRAAMFGGVSTTADALVDLSRRRGFAEVRTLPRGGLVVGRRSFTSENG